MVLRALLYLFRGKLYIVSADKTALDRRSHLIYGALYIDMDHFLTIQHYENFGHPLDAIEPHPIFITFNHVQ
jgi:hypothetical protein